MSSAYLLLEFLSWGFYLSTTGTQELREPWNLLTAVYVLGSVLCPSASFCKSH